MAVSEVFKVFKVFSQYKVVLHQV